MTKGDTDNEQECSSESNEGVPMVNLTVNIGIVTGEERRALEDYIDARRFTQRKSYDEYYIDSGNLELDLSISDLMILAERFKVIVNYDSVELSSMY